VGSIFQGIKAINASYITLSCALLVLSPNSTNIFTIRKSIINQGGKNNYDQEKSINHVKPNNELHEKGDRQTITRIKPTNQKKKLSNKQLCTVSETNQAI
jgi:hypothetical protein